MCPHKFSKPLTPLYEVPTPPPITQAYFCQKFTVFIKRKTGITFCQQCCDKLDPSERSNWGKVYKHTLIIDGILISFHCDKCQKRLTDLRIGEECFECFVKYNEFRDNPDLPEATYDEDTVMITIEVYEEELD